MNIMCPDARVYEDPRLAEAQRGIWHTMTKEQVASHMWSLGKIYTFSIDTRKPMRCRSTSCGGAYPLF